MSHAELPGLDTCDDVDAFIAQHDATILRAARALYELYNDSVANRSDDFALHVRDVIAEQIVALTRALARDDELDASEVEAYLYDASERAPREGR